MANRYKGEVTFKDSLQDEFVLRLGTFQWMEHQDRLNAFLSAGKGRDYQTNLFHLALINGSEKQKDMTLEDAVEILDDLGYIRANELMQQTKFGKNTHDASETERREQEAATARAAAVLKPKIRKMRKVATAPEAIEAIDAFEGFIDGLQPKEGSANPPESTASSS